VQFFRQILRDIKRGENVDLYVTVLVALGIAVLNLLGIAPQSLIASITLTVLGLLAVSALGNRHQFEELRRSFTRSIDDILLKEFPATLDEDFDSGKEIWLVGVTLRKFVAGKYIRIEEKLQKGHSIKILLVHPEGAAVELASSRYYAEINRDFNKTSSAIRDSLQTFCSLHKIAPDKVEIRTTQNPLTFGAIAVDLESSSGVLYLEHFPFRTVSGAMPKVVFRVGDGQWYEFFKREVYAIWNEGQDWKCG
jgi:hypothetical protein